LATDGLFACKKVPQVSRLVPHGKAGAARLGNWLSRLVGRIARLELGGFECRSEIGVLEALGQPLAEVCAIGQRRGNWIL
jgi:predicted oxidoreductase